jgi:hypothetical protein
MLAKDFGLSAWHATDFNGWLRAFNTSPQTNFGDMSFDQFSSLPNLSGGPWSAVINTALSETREAILKKPTTATLDQSGERVLPSSDDYWRGGGLSDRVTAGEGNDVLVLQAGNDIAQGGRGEDVIFGERGSDTLIGGPGNDFVMGGADRDKLYGWSGADMLFGGSGNDGIFGNEGNDTIFGGDGNDYICGGSGRDFLTGGAGADTFAFRGQAPNSVTVIKDFQVLVDEQKILASVAAGPLRIDMIETYAGGSFIDFGDGRQIYYENVFNKSALFASLSLFE